MLCCGCVAENTANLSPKRVSISITASLPTQAPGNGISLGEAWDTAGAEAGTYTILGYVLFDGSASDSVTAVVSTERGRGMVTMPKTNP